MEIKPLHLGLSVGAIMLTIFLTPFIYSAWEYAYPEAGSLRRQIVDRCAATGANRWSAASMAPCLASERVTAPYRR